MANGIFATNTDILYVNAGGAGDYSGVSGVFVDNVNRIISLTGDYASAIPQISANSANIAELSSKFEDCCSSVQGDITNLSSSITNISGDVINKLDISSFSAVSGNFLTAMPQGVMYEDRLDYTDDLSAISGYNGTPFVGSNSPSDGYELIEGNYVQLTDNSANRTTEISVTGLQPAGDYVTNTDLENVSSFLSASIDYVSAHAGGGGGSTSADYELIEGDYIQLLDNSANKTTQINVTGLPNFSDFASTGDLNALSSLVDNISGDVISISSTVSSSVTSLSSDIQYVSANCLTAHQSLDDYYKKTETSSKQEISAALASLQPGDPEVNQVVHTYSAEGKWLIASDLDPYLQKSESGNFYPMTGNPSGFLTSETDWTNTITAASSYAYSQATAQFPSLDGYATETYVQENVSSKMENSFSSNFYPMTGNPSGFLTAHQSLEGYATTAEVDAVSSILSAGLDYVSAHGGTTYTGDAQGALDEVYANSGVWLTAHQDISNLMPKSESGNFYPMTGNPSGFLTAHQSLDGYATETYVQEQTSGKIDNSFSGNFYPMTGNPSGFLTAHQDLSNYPTRNEISAYATSSQLNTVSSLLSANTITGSRYNTIYFENHNIEGTNSALSREENSVNRTVYKTQSAYLYDMGDYPYTSVKVLSPVATTAIYGIYNRGWGSEYKINFANVQANVEFNVPMTYGSDSLLGIYSDSNNAVGVTGYYGVSSIRELAWKSDLSSKQNTITYHYIEV